MPGGHDEQRMNEYRHVLDKEREQKVLAFYLWLLTFWL